MPRPLPRDASMVQPAPTPVPDEPTRRAASILVIDGNEEHQALSVTALGRRGFAVGVADNVREGVELARERVFDVVVLAHKVRGVSGLQALGTILEHLPRVPVIFVVPEGAEDVALKALEAGASGYLVKTARYHELLSAEVEDQLSKMRDRSRFRHQQEALEETEARYREVVESGSAAVLTVDSSGNIVGSTPTVSALAGYTAGELARMRLRDLLPGFAGEVGTKFIESLQQSSSTGSEFRLRRKDGAELTVEFTRQGPPREDKAGRIELLVRNVTELKRSEKQLQDLYGWLEALYEATEDAVLLADRDLRVVRWNTQAARLFAVEPAAMARRPVEDWLRRLAARAADPDSILHKVDEFKDDPEAVADGSLELTLPERRVYWRQSLPVRNPDGELIGRLWTFGDITERVQATEALRRRDAIFEAMQFAASRFLTTSRWEDAIDSVLQRLGEAAGVSRVWLFQNHKREDSSIVTREPFEWAAPGVTSMVDPPDRPSRAYGDRGFGRWEALLSRGDVIFGHAKEFPDPEREALLAQGIRSIVVVPIQVGPEWWGSIGFDQCDGEREWTAPEVDALRTAAGTLGSAILRAQTEKALRESEARYRRIAENAEDVIYRYRYTEPRGFEYVSPAVTKVTGYTPEEHYADPDLRVRLVHPDDLPLLQKAITDPPIFKMPLQLRWIRKDGEIVWTEQRNVPIFDEAGVIVAVEGIARDITDRKEAEQALRESEERYRLLFDNNPQPMWVYDTETLKFLAVNEAAIHHYGYALEEFLGMTIKDIRPEEDVPALMQSVKDPNPGVRISGLWRHLKKDGTVIDVDVVSHGVEFGNRPARIVLANDVTARRRAEEQVALSERRFRTLFEAAADGILVLDREGSILDVNPAGEAIVGGARSALLGRNLGDIVPAGELERAREYMREILRGSVRKEPFSIGVTTLDGHRRFLEVHSKAVREAGRDPYVEMVLRDVTESREMQRKLMESERLASIGSMAGYVAHEINNPLANISLLVAAAERKTKDSEILEKLSKISAQRRQAASIISDLLSFSKQRTIQVADSDLRSIIEAAIEQVAPYRKESVAVRTKLGSRPVPAQVDPIQMQEVFVNLLKNALEATSSGAITVALEEQGDLLTASVADTGGGMSPEILERLFEPFFTTKKKTGGTGLGLPLCRNVVTAHGGHIQVSSESGKGSIFTVLLPRKQPSREASP